MDVELFIQNLKYILYIFQLVVLMLSPSYIEDKHCLITCLHVLDVDKPYVAVCLGENKNWLNSDIGFKIGQKVSNVQLVVRWMFI